MKLERNDEALISFKKANEIEPENKMYWTNRGIALEALGRHEEAIEAFAKGD